MLLLHGFGDTPQTLRYLAEYLHDAGYSVRAPLYPGHGRTREAFFSSNGEEWIAAAAAALREFREQADVVSIVGLSMGAAVAAILAADDDRLGSVVLIAPYLRLPRWMQLALPIRFLWSGLVGTVKARHPRSIQNPAEREMSLAYGVVNARAMSQLAKVARRGRRALPRIKAATLVIQSLADPRVAPATARMALEKSGAHAKRIIWTKAGGHVITVDFGKDEVLAETLGWIKQWGGQPQTSRLPGKR